VPDASVAIVIPCYKQAHFLGDAIESALEQTHPASEILVIDDGSPDDVAGVTARYPSVRYIRQRNQGLSAARNTGIRNTSSEYLIFLDSDDRLLPHAVQRGVEHLSARPGCAFTAGRMHTIDRDGCLMWLWQPYQLEAPDFFAQMLIDHCRIYPLTVMYRRSAIEAVGGGFDTSLRSAEDWDMDIRLAQRFAFHLYDEPIAEYRRHGKNMSSNDIVMMTSIVKVLRSQGHLRRSRRYAAARKQGLRRVQERVGEIFIDQFHTAVREGRWADAVDRLLTIAWWHPYFYIERVQIRSRRLFARIDGRSKPELEPELAPEPVVTRRPAQ
jgi:glycosyltransferase involved in cell wall biosynthesis